MKNKKGQSPVLVFVLIVGTFICLVLMMASFSIVSDGEVGVYTLFGNTDDREYQQGFYVTNPFSTMKKVSIKQQTITETAIVPSKDGLSVTVDLSVIYRIKGDQASEIKQTVAGSIQKTKLIPIIRSVLRDVSSTLTASEIYSPEGRESVQTLLMSRLRDKIGDQIEIDIVLLRDVKLPPTIKASIEKKLEAQQKAEGKEFDLDGAKIDAQIEIARAEGIAKANIIIAEGLTPEYLQYKFIEGLNDGNTEVIYIPTEANLPLTEAMRLK